MKSSILLGPKAFRQGYKDQDKSSRDLIYMASFWSETKLVYIKKNKRWFFFNVKNGSIQGSICFKLVPELWVPGFLSQVALSYYTLYKELKHNILALRQI
jgi:hypothetical protein